MPSLSDALKDKKSFPDAQEVAIGDGLKITLGELRAYQEATGQDVAKQLDAERRKMAEEQAKLTKGQEEVVKLWTELQEAKAKQPRAAAAADPAADWRKDPFFTPIAEYLDKDVMAELKSLKDNYAQVQKALGLGVKYIADVISEQRYAMLPEDFRKETPYESAVKAAAEKRYLDAGGVPDVRKVYDEWQTPRQRDAELKKIRKEEYEKARQEVLSTHLARPSGVPVGAPPAPDPNAPKDIRASFARLKEDPEFLDQIYKLTGQA